MTARERVLAAINHEPCDRVATDLWLTPEVTQDLLGHFGTEDLGVVMAELCIDGMAGVGMTYTGPERFTPDGEPCGLWAMRTPREIRLPTGGVYYEAQEPPLKQVTEVAELADRNWENPADYDFAAAAEALAQVHDRQVTVAGYLAPFVDLWDLCGVETALLNLALRPELVTATLERVMTYRLEQHRLLFEACRGLIDVCHVTDDFGGQNGLLMSRDTVNRVFFPWYKEAIGLCHQYGIKVMHHDDGGMDSLIPDLIDLGVAILNPIQYKCWQLDLTTLKREYGRDLCFHGSVENQEIIPYGTPDQVRAEVRKNVAVLASDHTGLILAPCHNIQSGTPVENVLALYDEARRCGEFAP
ncbi:MAG: uroporphyrinogen decarboxylase family protein [Armatimonadota bacterium]